jgi:hypothetical protein
MGYVYKSCSGITRAHITPRKTIVETVLSHEKPLTETELFEYWLMNDKTLLCARVENRTNVPEYIPINNPNGDLLPSNPVAGFRVSRQERNLLESLDNLTESA